MDLSEFDIDFLSQRLSDNPQSPLFARLADLYLSKNQSSEALKLCEAGVQTYSSYATGYVVLGKCYLALNQNSKAKLAFTQALHLSPFNQIARRLLSEILHAVDESAEATGSESVAGSSPVGDTRPVPNPQIATSVVEEEAAPVPSLQEPEPVVEDVPVAPALEEAAQEGSPPEEVQIVESPVVATAPVQLDEIQIVESPAENVVSAPIVEESVLETIQPADNGVSVPIVEEGVPETIQPAEHQPIPLPGLDDYIQLHSANLAADNVISLDEYLSPAPAAIEPLPVSELETLASRIENAPRILPQESKPEASPTESVPSDSLVITPTLAEIYASQGEYGAAIQAYEILILSKPGDHDRYEKRIKELQAKLSDGG
jgi:tetratricopeptide (TPR) repeat protein